MENKNISEESFRLAEIERQDVLGYFDQYWRHASVLRNWFVAYGIGALTLVVSQIDFWKAFVNKEIFIGCIFIGIFLQVSLTFLNKVVHWFVYQGSNQKAFQTKKRYKWSIKIMEFFWIDILFDLLTVVSYGIACIIFISNICFKG